MRLARLALPVLPLLLALTATACSRPSKPGEGGADATASRPQILQAKGSDTMVNLAQRLSEEYAKVNPKVVIAVTGGGSGTGIKALVDKTTDMANASRDMKDDEIAQAKANGVEPVATVLAYDGLSIYVNAANPATAIDFEKLKCIYSADGACSHWKDVGVTMDCGNGDDTIVKVGRQNNSGSYDYFKEHVIGKDGKFTTTMDQSGTQQVLDLVGTTACAIGYGGMGYASATAKHLCLGKAPTDTCVEPTPEAVLAGSYPFSRPLNVYTNGAPTGNVKEYLDWARSAAGKPVVSAAGFVPVP